MTEAKFKRVIVATTIGAVLLLAVLVSVMVFQLISIKVHNDEIAVLEQKIAYYTELNKTGERTLEERQLERWIKIRAQELGYVDLPENLK